MSAQLGRGVPGHVEGRLRLLLLLSCLPSRSSTHFFVACCGLLSLFLAIVLPRHTTPLIVRASSSSFCCKHPYRGRPYCSRQSSAGGGTIVRRINSSPGGISPATHRCARRWHCLRCLRLFFFLCFGFIWMWGVIRRVAKKKFSAGGKQRRKESGGGGNSSSSSKHSGRSASSSQDDEKGRVRRVGNHVVRARFRERMAHPHLQRTATTSYLVAQEQQHHYKSAGDSSTSRPVRSLWGMAQLISPLLLSSVSTRRSNKVKVNHKAETTQKTPSVRIHGICPCSPFYRSLILSFPILVASLLTFNCVPHPFHRHGGLRDCYRGRGHLANRRIGRWYRHWLLQFSVCVLCVECTRLMSTT